MKILLVALTLLTLCASQSLLAHSDHSHGPISTSAAQSLALDVAKNLASRDAGLGFGQLAKSWQSIPAKNVVITKTGKGYYIVSVLNESENKTLHVLMSDGGEVYDANFTGKFKGVK